MRKTKKPPKATPPGRVFRTNAEIAEWLFRLDRRRKLVRVARREAACAEVLAQPETDPRRPYVARMQTLLAVARGNLERGQAADWQMAEIEALAGRMNRLVLEPLAAQASKFPGRTDAITQALAALVQADHQPRPRELWRCLAEQFGWQIVSETESGDEELRDAEGRVQLTYPHFTKRLDRAKKKRPPAPA